MSMQPAALVPCYSSQPWGGTKLKQLYNKSCREPVISESFELCCLEDSPTRLESFFSPLPLWQALENHGLFDCVGTGLCDVMLSITVKLIDAAEPLPIKVNPDEKCAQRRRRRGGKTEFWYIADCEPGSFICCGFKESASREEVERRVREGTLAELLNMVAVRPGDSFLIKPGTVFGAGAGCVIASVETDFGVSCPLFGETDGETLEMALDSIRPEPAKTFLSIGHIAKCEHFTVDRFSSGATFAADEKSFRHLLCLEGDGVLLWEGGALPVKKGGGLFIPANTGKCSVSGAASGILTYL